MDEKRDVENVLKIYDVVVITLNTIIVMFQERDKYDNVGYYSKLVDYIFLIALCFCFPTFGLFLSMLYNMKKQREFFQTFIEDYCNEKIRSFTIMALDNIDSLNVDQYIDLCQKYANIRDRKTRSISIYVELIVAYYVELSTLCNFCHPYRELGISI